MSLTSAPATSSISLRTEIPGPRAKALMQRRQQAVAPGPFHVTPLFAEKAQGALVTDVDGNQFIDFSSGIGVTNAGHNAPEIVEAIKAQADRYLHTSFNVVPYAEYIEVAERLNAMAPGDFAKKTFLVNSGSEAVENAIKYARAYTGRQGIVCFDHAYHGRTYMAMTLTAKSRPYKHGFAPFNPEVYRAPFPYLYRDGTTPGEQCTDCAPAAQTCQNCGCQDAFEKFVDVVRSQIGEDQVAGVIIEPVTGEGGFIPAPAAFLQKVQQFCREHGIVFMADEIQTGFGRTGTIFACEQLGVEPDILIAAKGLAGGMPLSAVIGRAEVMDAIGTGGSGGTYSGNPLACAAALAGFDLFEKGDLLDNARMLGEQLRLRLESWAERFEVVGDTRGLGPMRCVELVRDRATREPDKASVQFLVKYAYEHGVITIPAGTYGNVLRFLVPLSMTSDQLAEGLDVLEAGFEALGRHN